MQAFEDEHISWREFEYARREAIKRCAWFPKVKDFLDIVREYRNSPKYQIDANLLLKALPEETDNFTPEEIEQNQRRIEIIRKQLAGEMSMEDAEAEQMKLTTYARK